MFSTFVVDNDISNNLTKENPRISTIPETLNIRMRIDVNKKLVVKIRRSFFIYICISRFIETFAQYLLRHCAIGDRASQINHEPSMNQSQLPTCVSFLILDRVPFIFRSHMEFVIVDESSIALSEDFTSRLATNLKIPPASKLLHLANKRFLVLGWVSLTLRDTLVDRAKRHKVIKTEKNVNQIFNYKTVSQRTRRATNKNIPRVH